MTDNDIDINIDIDIDNIRLIEDVIDHFDKLQMNGVMFFADFQKDFDSLDWNFLFTALDFF